MACAPASLPSAGCRGGAFRSRASARAGAAAPAAAATTAPAGSAAPAAPAAGQIRAGGPSCGAPMEVGMAQVDAGAARPCAHAGVQREQKLARRTVGAVDDEAPAEPVGFGADFGAMALDPRLIFLAPSLRASDGDRVPVLRVDELDPTGEREGLLGGIDDLHHMSVLAVRRALRD